MQREGKLKIDLHNHTVLSGHAFSTLNEIIEKALRNDMIIVGISDHGPSMIGAPNESYFTMTNDIMNETNKVMVLFGCEANIMDINGSIDISADTIQRLNYVIAGLHKLTPYEFTDKKNNTKALIASMEKNSIFAISHPINESFPIDIIPVIRAAKDLDIAMEINDRVLKSKSTEIIKKYIDFIECCGENDVKMILSSDSHTLSTACNFSSINKIERFLNGIYLYNDYPEILIEKMNNVKNDTKK